MSLVINIYYTGENGSARLREKYNLHMRVEKFMEVK